MEFHMDTGRCSKIYNCHFGVENMTRHAMIFIGYVLLAIFMSKQSFCQNAQIDDLVHRITEYLDKHEADWDKDYQLSKPFSKAQSYVQSILKLCYGMDTNTVIKLLGRPDTRKKRHGKAGQQYGYKFEYMLRKKDRYTVNVHDESITVCFDVNGMIESVSFENGTIIDYAIFSPNGFLSSTNNIPLKNVTK